MITRNFALYLLTVLLLAFPGCAEGVQETNIGEGNIEGESGIDNRKCQEVVSSNFRRVEYLDSDCFGDTCRDLGTVYLARSLPDIDGDGKDELIATFFSILPDQSDLVQLHDNGTADCPYFFSVDCDSIVIPDIESPSCGLGYFMNASDIDNDGTNELISLRSYSIGTIFDIDDQNVFSLKGSFINHSSTGAKKLIKNTLMYGNEKIFAADVNSDGFLDLITYKENDEGCSMIREEADEGTEKVKCSTRGVDDDSANCPEGTTCAYFSLSNPDEQYCMPKLCSMINVFVGDGSGAFEPIQEYAFAMSISGIQVKDINNDTFVDILLKEYDEAASTNSFRLIQGDGSGRFTDSVVLLSDHDAWGPFMVGNFDNDGYVDILVSDFVLIGVGVGRTPTKYSLDAHGYEYFSSHEEIADIDNDGIDEILVRRQMSNSTPTESILIIYKFNNGMLNTTDMFCFEIGDNVATGDFNGDGIKDIAVPEEHKITVLYGPSM